MHTHFLYILDFDYKIFGQILKNTNASARIKISPKGDLYLDPPKSDIFIHPAKCPKCHKFFDGVEEQSICSLNHEVQESLIVDILIREKGDYENEWFDKTCRKKDGVDFQHSCMNKGILRFFKPNYDFTLQSSGYFR